MNSSFGLLFSFFDFGLISKSTTSSSLFSEAIFAVRDKITFDVIYYDASSSIKCPSSVKSIEQSSYIKDIWGVNDQLKFKTPSLSMNIKSQ